MAQLLKVEKAKFQGKSRSAVAKLLSKQVSEQLDELESDQTKFEYSKTLIDEFHKLELPDLEQTEEDNIAQVELNILKEEMKKLEMKQKAEKEDLENKIKALKHADKSVSKTVLENSEQKQSEPKHTLSLPDNCLLRKDFRLYGQTSIANQPDKLSFISLINQIDSGLSKGDKEKEIIEAVIRAIVPSLPLRSYLESVKDLTLNQLKSILRSHYREKQGAELYQMLATLSQLPGEDPRSFLLRGMNIRQKLILQGSQEGPYNLTYNPEHVQMLFLESLKTAFQSERITNFMKSHLENLTISDENLILHLNEAISEEEERQAKLAFQKKSKTVLNEVSKANCDEKKGKTDQNPKSASKSPLLAAVEGLQAQVAEIGGTVKRLQEKLTEANWNSQLTILSNR